MNTLKRTILKLVTILIFALLSSAVNAGYVDIAYSEKMVIKTSFHADGFIINADNDNNFGVGYGFKDGPIEVYFGIGAPEYIFSEIIYKNERHSIYDLSIKYQYDNPVVMVGYTYLVSDTFGYVARLSESERYIGFRKWIN